MPFSEAISRESPWVFNCMPTISSPWPKFMPMTPMDARPVGRTSLLWKWMHMPCLVTKKISLSASTTFTSISSSSSFKLMAMRPFLRTLAKSSKGVFLTIPDLVTMNKFFSSTYSLMGIMAVIFSPGSNCSKFTMAVPLAVRLASGIS